MRPACPRRIMEWEEITPRNRYMSATGASTIRRMVDSLIGENLTRYVPVRRASFPCAPSPNREAVRNREVTCPDPSGRPVHQKCASSEKNTRPMPQSRAFYTRMKKNGQSSRGSRVLNYAFAAMEQMELYCEAHPGSPSAVRRPRLFARGELWIALLGPSVEEGIVGIGSTVTAALRAFDAQYLAGLRPPAQAIGDHRTTRSISSAVV
jgi:hypothetical protein